MERWHTQPGQAGQGAIYKGWKGVTWNQHATHRKAHDLKHELFIPEIFHLILLDDGWPQVAETTNKGAGDYMDNIYI